MIKAESKGRFESRPVIPGHFQQGGKPSPMDRVRAVRLAVKCIQKLESYAGTGLSPEQLMKDDASLSVIGIRGSSVVFGSMKRLEHDETNWKDRRPLNESWRAYKKIVDDLSGRPKSSDCCHHCGKRKTAL